MKKYLLEVESLVEKYGKKHTKEHEAYLSDVMVKTSRYKILDVSKKAKQQINSVGFSFDSFSKKEQAKIWSYIFKNTQCLNVGSRAINFFRSMKTRPKDELQEYWPLLKTWVPHVENWVHGDMLAGVLNHIYTYKHQQMSPDLNKWVHGKSPWKRRMGLLTLFYYYNPKRHKPKPKLIEDSIVAQLEVDHYYLQKAAGWTTREYFSAYPKKGLKFIERHLFDFSPTAYSTAVERVDRSLKKGFAKRRSEYRKRLRLKK